MSLLSESDHPLFYSSMVRVELIANSSKVHVPTTKISGKGKGFAFLQYRDSAHAVEAFQRNDGTIFQGRLLHIISAESKRDSKLDEFAISKLPLKKQKELKRKAGAAGLGFNWNSLYMNVSSR